MRNERKIQNNVGKSLSDSLTSSKQTEYLQSRNTLRYWANLVVALRVGNANRHKIGAVRAERISKKKAVSVERREYVAASVIVRRVCIGGYAGFRCR